MEESEKKAEVINKSKKLQQRIAELEKREIGRKQLEKTSRESEEKFRAICAAAQDGIIMMDNEGIISYWNKAAQRIFGYTEKEAIGKEVHIFLAPEKYHKAYRKGFSKFKKTGQGPVGE